jgi:hypothetical protein
MRKILFNKDNLTDEAKSSRTPVVVVVKAIFISDDNDWVQRLSSTLIKLETVALDNNEKEVCSFSRSLSLGAYITSGHKHPIFEINYTEKFNNTPSFDRTRISYWKTTIVLKGIEFNENESLTVFIIESGNIENHVDY